MPGPRRPHSSRSPDDRSPSRGGPRRGPGKGPRPGPRDGPRDGPPSFRGPRGPRRDFGDTAAAPPLAPGATGPGHSPVRGPLNLDPARDAVGDLLARHALRYPRLDPIPLELPPGISPRDAALAHAIADAAIRRLLTLRFLLQLHLTKPFETLEAGLKAAMLLGAAQLVFLDRVPDYAAINHAVEWAKRRIRPGAGAMANAVLRKVASMRPGPDTPRPTYSFGRDQLPLPDGSALLLPGTILPDETVARLAAATSHPEELIKSWSAAFGFEQAKHLALHSIADAPVVINTAHAASLLDASLVTPHERPGFAVFTGPHESLRPLIAGRADIWVQDPASAEAVASIADLAQGSNPPRIILDGCAGQGTKTRQLAATFPNSLIAATDTDPRRFETLSEVFAGSQRVRAIAPDRLLPELVSQVDLVVLDVPCSNTAVLSRRPEAKYRANAAAINDLAAIQRQIIADSIPLLSPRGQILYSTCSLDARENDEQVAWAAKWHQFGSSKRRVTTPAGGPGKPPTSYTDGSFSVLLSR